MYDEEQYQYQPPPRSPVPAAILTSLITTVGVFFGLRVLEERGLLNKLRREPDAVEVPSLLGIRPEQAREILKGRDLLLSIAAEREDSKYTAGTIASQTPLPGSQAGRGTPVQAVVSRGTGQVSVPNVVGLRTEDATRQLVAAGLQAGPTRAAPGSTAPAGTVLQTEPAAASPVAPGSAVGLVVSAAAPAQLVPKVTGMRLGKAKKALEDAGFKVAKLRYISDADRSGGIVLRQDPVDGSQAAPGTGIDLLVNDD